jgi:hypothetical protein
VAAVTYMYTNMNEGTNLIKTGGGEVHEKHAVATWSLGNHPSIHLQTQGNPVAGPSASSTATTVNGTLEFVLKGLSRGLK